MQRRLLCRLRGWREALIPLVWGGIAARAACSADVHADQPDAPADATLVMRDGIVSLSERGGAFEPLQLGDSDAGRLLRQLLQRRGSAPLGLAPTMIADGVRAFTLDHAAWKPETAAAKAATARPARRKSMPEAIMPGV